MLDLKRFVQLQGRVKARAMAILAVHWFWKEQTLWLVLLVMAQLFAPSPFQTCTRGEFLFIIFKTFNFHCISLELPNLLVSLV